ncbi:MAG: Gfo/Idh/MocA family oxidoreductase [Verrucomicrobia bacterium]|nr:Gfo/Idh/MocA family oxidoreductase [Verrucomicrobiota bacterium]
MTPESNPTALNSELETRNSCTAPRAVLVGCGAMSGEWLRSAAALGIEIVALVDIEEKNAKARAQEFSLTGPIFTDFKDAIRDTPADMLFDCTIPAAHKEVSSAALQAGLHVLEEKPLALTLEDAVGLVHLAKASGKLHAILQNRRFKRGVRLMRKMLREGVIGEITTVHVDFFIGPHFGGFRESMPHVLLADMAIHPFDTARFLTGANATAVFCEEWVPKNSWYRFGPSVVAVFRMENDIRFSYRASWCADGFRTAWDACWRIIGTEGTLLWDGEENVRAERLPSDHLLTQAGAFLKTTEVIVPEIEPDPFEVRGHFSVMRQFLAAMHGGPLPETTSSDNIHSLAMVLAAVESAEQGKWAEVRNDW